MELLLILCLAGVAVWQARRIGALSQRVAELERRLSDGAAAQLWAPPAPAAAQPQATADQAPLTLDTPLPREDEPLILTHRVADDELLLDTPLPEASNDVVPLPPPPVAEPARIFDLLRPPPQRKKEERRFEQWLAENGLAWLAGGALTLGLIFLVSFAAQQNWFTPNVRLTAAALLGAALLIASEFARRIGLKTPPGHPLVAALLAAGGVVALYATAWGAHALYDFIGMAPAAALLTCCAALLIGLSFLHGQALGVLAIIAAMLAPALTGVTTWPSPALTLYIFAVGAAGFALAALQRWGWAALATIGGLYFWFWSAIGADEVRRALGLLSFASFGGVALALRAPLKAEAGNDPLAWERVRALGPSIAVAVSSVLVVWAWLAVAPQPSGATAGPALIGVFHVALAAYAVRGRVAAPEALIVAIGALIAGFIAYLRARFYFGPLGADFLPTILFAGFTIVVSALGAKPHRSGRLMTAAAGAIGAGLLVLLASFSRGDWNHFSAWTPLFGGALLLFAAAWHASRDASPTTERVVDFWAGAGAALVLLGIESAFPAEARTAAHAGAALLAASAFAWTGWRVLRFAALTAAALTLAHALSPSLFGAALSGAIPLWGALLILIITALLLFGAGYFATAEPRSPYGEALAGAGAIIVLVAAFLAVRWFAAGGAGGALDPFTESALRALALMAAGHVVMARPGQELGRIGRWRGHVLMGAGILLALLSCVLAFNPWWGQQPALIVGPPLLDTLTLAFLAPAIVAGAAAARLYTFQRTPARIYAVSAALFALVWATLMVRRFAHGAAPSAAPVTLLEGAIYALVFLVFALGVALIARRRLAKHGDGPFTQDAVRAMRGGAWIALIVAGFILLTTRHPVWGDHLSAGTNALETGLAALAQLAAAGLALALGRALSLSRAVEATRFAAATAAVLFTWSFGHSAIRWLYHFGAMDNGDALFGLEGFEHALWPLSLTVVAAELTARAPGRDTVRAYLYDLQAIWSAAVWPAAAFGALGLWLLFNPWWGVVPAQVATPISATLMVAALLLAAWLTRFAKDVPHLRWAERFNAAATIAAILHLLLAATLLVRWLMHGEAVNAAAANDVELWIYSAVWALFGAGAFAWGLVRNDALTRWSGLAILVATTLFVYFLTFTRLTGVIRALSAIGLSIVLFVVAWLARTYRPVREGDLANVTPGARRERRYGRRGRTP